MSTDVSRLRSGHWLTMVAGGLAVVALAGVIACVLALERLGDARELLADRLDPATSSALELSTALLNEETGVRGYVLAGRPAFLEPYTVGRREEQRTLRALASQLDSEDVASLRDDVVAVQQAAAAWRSGYAEPAIAATRRDGAAPAGAPSDEVGRDLFDTVRRAQAALREDIRADHDAARRDLDATADTALIAVIVVGAVLLAAVAATAGLLRRLLTVPLARLSRAVRQVSRGNFGHTIEPGGPRDVAELGADVDLMRRRILAELAALEEARERLAEQAAELERSNAELEQFAYVASHDLQEPLRKVTSFCQMLERRYGGQLDERGQQYIDFAVDGAKRMQILINDLLAFSRVGHQEEQRSPVDLDDVVAVAEANLATAIEESGARVVVAGDLPVVQAAPTLLSLVFQNLIGNAIKFRGDAPPVVQIAAREAQDDAYEVTISDNGIGIPDEYADRIFIIFQRLHAKEDYPGTGIGLAMCRKIVEHHGGRLWLETGPDAGTGASFRFTLPRPKDTP